MDEQRAGDARETGVNTLAIQGTTMSVRGAAGLVTLGRLAAADIEMWSKSLADWSRNPEIYGVIVTAEAGAWPEAESGHDYQRALYSLIWKLNCFTKPSVTLLSSDTPPWVMALAMAGTHQAASAGFRFQCPDPGQPSGYGLGAVHAALMGDRDAAAANRSIGRADAHAVGLVTHCINEVAFPAITTAMVNADPIDPELDDRHVAQERAPIAGAAAQDLRAALISDFAKNAQPGTPPLDLISRAALQAPPT